MCLFVYSAMPEAQTSEILTMKRFLVAQDSITAEFDYCCVSPDPLGYLRMEAALIQIQKIIYVFCCARLGLPVDTTGRELLKVWPTRVDVSKKGEIGDAESVTHRIGFSEFRKIDSSRYFITVESTVNDSLLIGGDAIIQVLEPI